jgi:hypothetical protein
MKFHQYLPFITLLIPTVLADAHFQSTPTSTVSSTGALTVSFDEAGLGHTNVDYVLAYHFSAVFGCFNNGGKHPKAQNKATVSSDSTTSASFEPKNGRVRASISTGAPSAGAFSCPSGQTLRLASVSYTGITLTDVTNNVAASVPDASRVFISGV